jgi:hypothetical protein
MARCQRDSKEDCDEKLQNPMHGGIQLDVGSFSQLLGHEPSVVGCLFR